MSLLQQILPTLARPLLVLACILIPYGIVIAMVVRERRKYRAKADEPFTELPLRPPGEALRNRIDELATELLFDVAAVPLFAAALLAIYGIPTRVSAIWVPLALLVAGTGYLLSRIRKRGAQLQSLRLGYLGERVVGEELNQLLASGFRVFHDLPFDNFNIDHVIVGAPGVYAVETKARRKPKHVSGPDRATVVFDGATLRFPNAVTAEPLEQSRRNAQTLARWLTRATGEPVEVNAIVTLPGWFVDRRARGDVNVLNPIEIKRSFPLRPPRPLSPEQIQRISHQLTERCRMPKEANAT